MSNRSKTSYIEDHEEEEAKRFVQEKIDKEFGEYCELPRACGCQVVVWMYVRPQDISSFTDEHGNKKSIILPEAVTRMDKWSSCVGLVIGIGPSAYEGKEVFEKNGPFVKVGDWVVFPRHEGLQLNYRGFPIQVFYDDRALLVVKDPTYVTRD